MLKFRQGIPNRNTKAYVVEVGNLELFISYQTVIAVRTGSERARLRNDWGPTTGRHINEMGLRDWPIVTEARLEQIASDCCPVLPGERLEQVQP